MRRRRPSQPMSLDAAGRCATSHDDIPDDAVAAAAGRAARPRRARSRPTTRRTISRRRSNARAAARAAMRGPAATTAMTMPAALNPPATLACPIVSALDRWVSQGVQPAAMRWFGSQVAVIKQIGSYSCRDMVGAGGSIHVRARVRRCARHRRLHARRRPQHHGQGRLARLAGRAGLPARRAAFRLRDVLDGAGARLQRLSLRPHPRGPDAARRADAIRAGRTRSPAKWPPPRRASIYAAKHAARPIPDRSRRPSQRRWPRRFRSRCRAPTGGQTRTALPPQPCAKGNAVPALSVAFRCF